jgi:hypothetical protein
VDLAARPWNLPAASCKDRRAHTVPLVTAAVELLREAGPKASGCVLDGLRGEPRQARRPDPPIRFLRSPPGGCTTFAAPLPRVSPGSAPTP